MALKMRKRKRKVGDRKDRREKNGVALRAGLVLRAFGTGNKEWKTIFNYQ